MYNRLGCVYWGAGLLCAVVGSVHCSAQPPQEPQIVQVIPNRLVEGTSAEIEIRGSSFSFDVDFDFGDPKQSRVDDVFYVWIGSVALESVVLINSNVLKAIVPATLAAGTYDLRLVDPAGSEATLEGAVVVEQGTVPGRLQVEDAPGGAGQRLDSIAMDIGTSLQLYAVLRTNHNAFVADSDVTWRVSNAAVATVNPSALSAQATAEGRVVGSTVLEVTSSVHGSTTVPIAVNGDCTHDSDCQSPCFGAATCVAGRCILGNPTRDQDGDGAIDAACGGTDCDDDPAGCGASCRPGAVELCDGLDNDCDLTTADGSSDPGLGMACDGPDSDLCTDDVFDACVTGSLVCDSGNIGADNTEVIADGIDQDCNGVDACYADLDDDGFGSAAIVNDNDVDCFNDTALTSGVDTDCDDSNASIFPGTTCNDGSVCTANDVCHAGVCRGYNTCGGSCGVSCNGGCGGSGNCCVQNCPGGSCETCEPGCSCDQTCNGSSTCHATCAFGSSCHVLANSIGNDAVLTCQGGASCFFECNSVDDDCRLDCQGNAMCMIWCNSVADCQLDCPAGGTSCGGGVAVCNRPCP